MVRHQVFPAKFKHSEKVLPGNVEFKPGFFGGLLAEAESESPAPEAFLTLETYLTQYLGFYQFYHGLKTEFRP